MFTLLRTNVAPGVDLEETLQNESEDHEEINFLDGDTGDEVDHGQEESTKALLSRANHRV